MAYDLAATERCEKIIRERKNKAEEAAEARKKALFARSPRLQEIDQKLSRTGLEVISMILAHDPGAYEKVLELEKSHTALLQEQNEILASLGSNPEALEPAYTCSVCEDTGWEKSGRRCQCFESLLRMDACERLAAASPLHLSDFEHFDLAFYSQEPDPDGHSPREWMSRILKACKEYAEEFDPDFSEGLLFLGKTGLGKTHLALAIAKECIQKGYSVVYDSCQNLMTRLEKEHFGKEKDDRTLETLCSCDLLIIDDLGTEFFTAFVGSMLYTLLNSRIAKGLPTIISTNLDPAELEEKYGDRLVSRIFSSFTPYRFRGSDIRMIKRKQKRTGN
ncbi:MAG: ATP-binding protein [Oscillospiraceae bacterium]|nr:ATP-binding protein [Oscillospiraceae bacterium]